MAMEIDEQKLRSILVKFLEEFLENRQTDKTIQNSQKLVEEMRSANLFEIIPEDIREGLNTLGVLCFQPGNINPIPSNEQIKKVIKKLKKQANSEKIKDKTCIKCGNSAVETLITVTGKREDYCAKHWVENEGEGCLESDLLNMEDTKTYDMGKEVAKEIKKQFPKLAELYKAVLDKVLKS